MTPRRQHDETHVATIMSNKPSPEAVAMHALLICVQTVEFIANPANDITATVTKP